MECLIDDATLAEILKWYFIGAILYFCMMTVDLSIYRWKHKKHMMFIPPDITKMIARSFLFHWLGVFLFIDKMILSVKYKKMNNNVSHPKHYNQHPAGFECIEIIRHHTCDTANAIKYLWRAGLKTEMGMNIADKEIEDLKKSIYYIEDDVRYHGKEPFCCTNQSAEHVVFLNAEKQRLITCKDVVAAYCPPIAEAIENLWDIGVIVNGQAQRPTDWYNREKKAIEAIQQRILDIQNTATPASQRETAPEHYDPLNIIIQNGTAYCLTDEVRKKANGALYSPCENCALSDYCINFDLCRMHGATEREYYHKVGIAKYAIAGTIEVVDEVKEFKKEMNEEV